MKYLVVWRRFDGVGSEVGEPADFTEKSQAKTRIEELYAGWEKPHHGEYEIVPYNPKTKSKDLAEAKVAPYF